MGTGKRVALYVLSGLIAPWFLGLLVFATGGIGAQFEGLWALALMILGLCLLNAYPSYLLAKAISTSKSAVPIVSVVFTVLSLVLGAISLFGGCMLVVLSPNFMKGI